MIYLLISFAYGMVPWLIKIPLKFQLNSFHHRLCTLHSGDSKPEMLSIFRIFGITWNNFFFFYRLPNHDDEKVNTFCISFFYCVSSLVPWNNENFQAAHNEEVNPSALHLKYGQMCNFDSQIWWWIQNIQRLMHQLFFLFGAKKKLEFSNSSLWRIDPCAIRANKGQLCKSKLILKYAVCIDCMHLARKHQTF